MILLRTALGECVAVVHCRRTVGHANHNAQMHGYNPPKGLTPSGFVGLFRPPPTRKWGLKQVD